MDFSAPDTVWVLVSTILVMLMTPGLAFFYAGLTHQRNTLNTLLMSFACLRYRKLSVGISWVLTCVF